MEIKLKTKDLKRGFTLIELLVVISIIGVLAGLVISNVSGVRERARDAQRKSDLNEIKSALKMYHNDYDDYPMAAGVVETAFFGCVATPPSACSWGSDFTRDSTTYMKVLPKDPLDTVTSPTYYKYTRTDRDNFSIFATLENKSDNDIVKSQIKCKGAADGSLNYYNCSD